MTLDRKRTKIEERWLAKMVEDGEALNSRTEFLSRTHNLLPRGWEGLDWRAPCGPKKAKVTVRLDEDVLEWFRNLGQGYQTRMNMVLRLYMQAVLSKYLKSRGDESPITGGPI